ncbi:MAG: DUF192 domain-containing protein [Fluviibacter sp.]|jgi:uncharacterized membrane protein (UPF0127 family)
MTFITRAGITGLILFVLSAMAQAANLPVIRLSAGTGNLEVEVASNKAQRSLGLMNRASMPESRGMLFVYPAPAYFCMWMKNTKIPLSVAFIDAQGQVINIEDMAPQTETNHCTQRNATYALEANRGWFAKHGVVAGSQIIGLEKAPQGEY